jgi:competence protein ComEC
LLVDPLSVLLSGFWLSFAGVAWLLWCLPAPGQSLLRGLLSAQAVVSVGLLPLTVAMFEQISLIGPLLNLLAIPWWTLVVVPLAILGTALEALLAGSGIWAWQAAAWCFELSWPLFDRLGHGRLALWWLPESGMVAMLLALLAAFWLLLPIGTPGKSLALLLWLPLLWPQRELPATGEFEMTVLDVGQGLSVLLRTEHHALLYDAGPAVRDGFDAGERTVVPALRAVATAVLDRVVISHADSDHAGGYAAVRAVVPVTQGSYAPQGAPIEVDQSCRAGDGWQWDGVRFVFLHPSQHFPYLRNESSCVLRVEGKYGAALLTGDIGEVVERHLLREQARQLRADVVFAPHHGSARSSQPAFVAATGARLVVVSSGYRNRFGHPRPDVVQRWRKAGAEVVNTADSGALRIWLGGDGVQLRERRRWHRRLWDAAERQRSAAILAASEKTAIVPEG